MTLDSLIPLATPAMQTAEAAAKPVVKEVPLPKPPAKAASSVDALGTLLQHEAVTMTGGIIQRGVTNALTQAQKAAPAPKKPATPAKQASTPKGSAPAAPATPSQQASPPPAPRPVAPAASFLRNGVAVPLDAAHDLTPEALRRMEHRQSQQPATDWDPLK